MIPIDLTLTEATEGDKTFSLVSVVDGKSIRRDGSAPIGSPCLLTVSHGKRDPKNPNSPDRHLVRLDRTKVNTDGEPEVLSCYFVLENPVTGTHTDANIETLKNLLINFLSGSSGANFNRFQNSEP
jgi:hypothetical protein